MKWLYKPAVVHTVAVLAGIYMIYYLIWRFSETLNPQYIVFSLLLLAAEFQGFLNFLLFTLMTWDISSNDPLPVLEAFKTIDVFVPTYNEDLEILEATLTGCVHMRLNHTTYVLDDGRRPQVKELADRLGCRYLTRPDNKYAKAGNINAALKQTTGELVAVLDADMVPQPDFLEKLVGYFKDDRVAIVQTPQEFYNLDSVQHTNSWHEQELFYRVIQPGKDNIGATFWCGSPSLLSRKALEDIGGVATESITEDFQTSIRLNAKGWKIRFHNEVLAYGIAAQSLHAFNSQRLRWAQGAMQILRSKDNPLAIEGLTWKQELSHFSAILTYFDSYQKLLYLLAPALFLVFGMLPVQIDNGLSFFLHWFPYFVLTLLANICLGRGYFRYFDVERYNFLKIFTFIRASLIFLWPKSLNFKVTPKTVDKSVKQKDRVELHNHFLILGVMALSFVIAIIHVLRGDYHSNRDFINLGISLFWLLINGVLLFTSIKQIITRLYLRKDYRFPLHMPGKVLLPDGSSWEITIHDISRKGLGFAFNFSCNNEIEKEVPVQIQIVEEDLQLQGTVIFDQKSGPLGGLRRIGVHFGDLPLESQEKLVCFLFITLPRKLSRSAEEKSGSFILNPGLSLEKSA